MNWAHWHLLLNHIPVLGSIFGLTLLGWAMIRRDASLQRAALGAFVVVALLALPAYFTGEPAEEVVDNIATVATSGIDAHQDAALGSLIGIVLLGVVALVGLYTSRGTRALSAALARAVLLGSLVTAGLMGRTAYLGGQIHHQEIRAGSPAPAEQGEVGEGQ
jgi:uncharacterized membrane protein